MSFDRNRLRRAFGLSSHRAPGLVVFAPPGRCHARVVFAVGGEYAVETSRFDSWTGVQTRPACVLAPAASTSRRYLLNFASAPPLVRLTDSDSIVFSEQRVRPHTNPGSDRVHHSSAFRQAVVDCCRHQSDPIAGRQGTQDSRARRPQRRASGRAECESVISVWWRIGLEKWASRKGDTQAVVSARRITGSRFGQRIVQHTDSERGGS